MDSVLDGLNGGGCLLGNLLQGLQAVVGNRHEHRPDVVAHGRADVHEPALTKEAAGVTRRCQRLGGQFDLQNWVLAQILRRCRCQHLRGCERLADHPSGGVLDGRPPRRGASTSRLRIDIQGERFTSHQKRASGHRPEARPVGTAVRGGGHHTSLKRGADITADS